MNDVPVLDETHEASARSWLASAGAPGHDFPLQNLPFTVFRPPGAPARVGVGLGDAVIDVAALRPVLASIDPCRDALASALEAVQSESLNALMSLGHAPTTALRQALFRLYRDDAAPEWRSQGESALWPQHEVELMLPVRLAGYTDFFASVQHATNAGRLFRPDQPLLPNYKHLPVAYNGRAGSVQVASTVRRPRGQIKPTPQDEPHYAPTERLDHEVELGCYLGQASRRGEPVAVGEAWRHVFGFSLLNDWSARDIQAWEYQPLGPFLGKSFATGVSPWVVTSQALLPFRGPARARDAGDPPLLPHLAAASDRGHGGLDVSMQAWLRTQRMREQGSDAVCLSTSSTAGLYWTVAQMVAHHTSNGAPLDTGDLLGSGRLGRRARRHGQPDGDHPQRPAAARPRQRRDPSIPARRRRAHADRSMRARRLRRPGLRRLPCRGDGRLS